MDPPQCVQNAMMTKDKKPFTYTPGGIDLSEVKSPRMQRRIERNANLGNACDTPQPPHPPPQLVGPLPPSALAAMRPQTQVQVFPSPPPPPSTSKGIPPPPPPPTCPLPTQKVTTVDNQVIERPDMTKIIPDNPMSLLRKTGGPAPRKSIVDQMFEEQSPSPPAPPQRNMEAQSPRPTAVAQPVSPPVQQQRQPQVYQPPPQQYQPPQNQYQPQQYQPPLNQYQSPAQHYQPPPQQYQPPPQQYQPPPQQYQPPPQQYQPPPQQYQPVQQQKTTESSSPVGYHPPIIERSSGGQQRNVNSNVGSLYIPPIAQQQQKVASPPTPPERQAQSPGTPTLKEAPRPWQQRNVQQELPPWAKKDEVEQAQAGPTPPNRQNRWGPQVSPAPAQQQQAAPLQPAQQFSPRPQAQPQTQNQNYPQNSFPVHIEIRAAPYQQESQPSQMSPNAVYVTQPIVLQHPGLEPPYRGPSPKPQQPQQQYQQPRQQPQPKVDSSGARIIPIQIEGRTPPATPAGDRNFNRQLSWGTQPPQSNTFKVIQKITKTDDEDDDTPITQHSARYPQEMPEQVRRMKINDNGHFQQGNGQPQPYVHPSEQVVPEPKKYMGSNIPSRSFKILQAMTAPSDSSANANYNEEPPYNPPVFNPYNYPYYPPPYWPDYYSSYYLQEQSEQVKASNEKTMSKNDRTTAIPHPPTFYYPQEHCESTSKMSEKGCKNGRSTPLPAAIPMPPPMPAPYWGYLRPPTVYPRATTPQPEGLNCRPQAPKANPPLNKVEGNFHYPIYPPYFDPYYYGYFYGYPPMAPPYPYYAMPAPENEEFSGYSSMDEISSYNPSSRRSSLKRRNSLENGSNSVQVLRQHFEVRSKSAAPRITITPTYSQENLSYDVPPDKEESSEAEDGDDGVVGAGDLRSIKSVQNLSVYAAHELVEDTDRCSESEESTEEEQSEEEDINSVQDGNELIPHQLSIIFEESERGESRRSLRCGSIASETTTIAEHPSEEEQEEDSVMYSSCATIAERSSEEKEEECARYHCEPEESFPNKGQLVLNPEIASQPEEREAIEEEDFLACQNVKYKIKLFQETNANFSVRKSSGSDGRRASAYEERNESLRFSGSFKRRSHSDIQREEVTFKQSSSVKDGEQLVFENNNDVKTSEGRSSESVKEKPKQSDDDWWGVIESSKESKIESVVHEEVVCDMKKPKADSVMVEVDGEIVCVKLRNKPGRGRRSVENTATKNETSDNSFFTAVPKRNSIYEMLKSDENGGEESLVISKGTLMRVDSFASQLEAIKRNSGLFTSDDNSFVKPKTMIEEESLESRTTPELVNCDQQTEEERNGYLVDANSISDKKTEEVKPRERESPEEIDFWSQIKNDDDDFTPRRRTIRLDEDKEDFISAAVASQAHSDSLNETEDAIDSTNSSDSSSSESQKCEEGIEPEISESSSSSSDEDREIAQEVPTPNRSSNSRSTSVEPPTLKARIKALRNSIAEKQKKITPEAEGATTNVTSRISSMEVPIESRSKTASTKSSIKSFEEYSEEEELDSGVISDISRHISDSEEFPELRKMTKYERAATHSRLFRLLQDECDIVEEKADDEVFVEKEDKFSKLSVRKNKPENKLSPSRSKLSLPLNHCSNPELPAVNQKLVEELIQSLLKSKKAQVFKNMPKEKLYAAAVTILQEGVESGETPSEEFSSLLSPLRGGTQSSTPAQTPQEFYADSTDYKQYYESWSDAAIEIVPSKAFKLLQEHIETNKLGSIEGILAKCPRVLSTKNIPKEIMKFLNESSDCSASSSLSHNLPNSNDISNT